MDSDTASDTNDSPATGYDGDITADVPSTPYDCDMKDTLMCDAVACLYDDAANSISDGCARYGEDYCTAVGACLTNFDVCLHVVCPQGSTAKDEASTDTCSYALSICLTDAGTRYGTQNTGYRKINLLPSNDNAARDENDLTLHWYGFSDNGDNGDGASYLNGDVSSESSDFTYLYESVCVNGLATKILEDRYDLYWGAGFGGNLCTHDTLSDCSETAGWPEQFVGVSFDIEGNWGRELRVLFHQLDIDESAYVIVPPGATHVVALVDQAHVWYNPGSTVDIGQIDAIQFQIPSNTDMSTAFDLCISNFSALLTP